MYASRAAPGIDQDELIAILRKSKANNPAVGVTGVLCLNEAIFLQALEGGRSAVNQLYNRIVCDPATSKWNCCATKKSSNAAFPAGRWAR